jgi:mannan endo-1,4-beta-mannosidase
MPSIKPRWRGRPKFSGPGKLIGPIIALSLATIATAVYLSPSAPPLAQQAGAAADGSDLMRAMASRAATSGASTSPSKTPSVQIVRTMAPDDPHATTTVTTIDRFSSTKTVAPPIKAVHCTDFKWQQDAQAAYAANLSDPWGLDSAAGPNNGDGLACTQLAIDPSRAASVAIGAYSPPKPTAGKSDLVTPVKDYYGLAMDGLPGDTGLFNTVATAAQKAPSAIEWFANFDTDYDQSKVIASWSHGALPIITWMSQSSNSSSPDASSYTLANIANGHFDSYLLHYAGSILSLGMPVAIRFDHEMNGNWYPWSAGFPANKGATGQPNLYVQAWRHIWNLFDSVGANSEVIWLWAPIRVDKLTPGATTGGAKYDTGLAEDYPGDQYVDWVGMSAYDYRPNEVFTFANTFSATITALHSLTSKPIFIAETGVAQASGTIDLNAQKASWTTQALAGFLANRNIIGFSWFNNTVNAGHFVDGQLVETDWRFTSSSAAQNAFVNGIADPRYASGIMPDGTS